MSLINDALKQAGKAQKENPPPPSNLPLRAADERPHRSYTPPAIMYAVFIVVLVLGGLLIAFALRKTPEAVKANAPSTQANSKTPTIPETPTPAAPVEQKANPIVFPKPVAPPPTETPVETQTPAAQPPPPTTSSPEPPGPPQPAKPAASPAAAPADAAAVTPTATNTTSIAPPVELPKPAKPKLQGISYNPTRPSAVVNGRTLYVGDRIGEFSVREITKDAVTLASSTQTYVLSLSD